MITISLEIPDETVDAVIDQINAFPEVDDSTLGWLIVSGRGTRPHLWGPIGEALREAVIPLMR